MTQESLVQQFPCKPPWGALQFSW